MKNVDQRRERKQKEVSKFEEAKEMMKVVDLKGRKFERLIKEIDIFKEKIATQDENTTILERLYESGIIDEKWVLKIKYKDHKEME